MPKRDVAYMQGQRDQIARVALECMIENGVAETSMRDVCKRAGISIGALYVHFATKDDLLLAVCALDAEAYYFNPLPRTWAELEAAVAKLFTYVRTERQMRRMRMSLQFAAELAVTSTPPAALVENYQLRLTSLRATLEQLHRLGEISLPLGLDATTSALFDYFIGVNYVRVATYGPKPVEDLDAVFAAMALIAGRQR